MSKFKYVSLFAGIGGFDEALNKLGGECVLASEIDKYASQAYKAVHGGDVLHGDITKIDEKEVPEHDLITFGFPCQSFSVAGKRGGFEDARGTMFFEAARIIAEKKPKLLLAENVKGLVGHDKGKTMDTIVKTLNDIGYRVDFDVLNSKYFGVPQNRERIFIVGVREDLIENETWTNVKGTKVIPKGKRRLLGYEGVKTFNFEWPAQEEVTKKLIDILEPAVDERFYLSDEKTAELVAKLDEKDKVEGTVGHHPFSKKKEFSGYHSDVSPCLIATDYKAPKTTLESGVKLPAEPPFCLHNIYGGFKEDKPRVFEGESPTIRTSAGGGHLPSVLVESPEVKGCSTRTRSYRGQGEQLEIRKDDVGNTITSVAKDSMVIDGLPIREATKKGYAIAKEGDAVNYKFPSSNTRRGRVGKQMAHTIEATAFSQGVVEQFSEGEGVTCCLDANYSKGTSPGDVGKGRRTPVVETKPRYRIRKLTPLECFRLQGFSDEVHQKIVDAGISDSQRYKMAGNAVSVPVIEAIGVRLLPFIS